MHKISRTYRDPKNPERLSDQPCRRDLRFRQVASTGLKHGSREKVLSYRIIPRLLGTLNLKKRGGQANSEIGVWLFT